MMEIHSWSFNSQTSGKLGSMKVVRKNLLIRIYWYWLWNPNKKFSLEILTIRNTLEKIQPHKFTNFGIDH